MENKKFVDREFICWWNPDVYILKGKLTTKRGRWFLNPKNGYTDESVEKTQNLNVGDIAHFDEGHHIVVRIK